VSENQQLAISRARKRTQRARVPSNRLTLLYLEAFMLNPFRLRNLAGVVAAGAVAGLGAAYFLTPGRRRQVVNMVGMFSPQFAGIMNATSAITDSFRGVRPEQTMSAAKPEIDGKLQRDIAPEIKAAVSDPRSIDVIAEGGHVVVTGDVAKDELPRLEEKIAELGVKDYSLKVEERDIPEASRVAEIDRRRRKGKKAA
jgi:hypothetical protein